MTSCDTSRHLATPRDISATSPRHPATSRDTSATSCDTSATSHDISRPPRDISATSPRHPATSRRLRHAATCHNRQQHAATPLQLMQIEHRNRTASLHKPSLCSHSGEPQPLQMALAVESSHGHTHPVQYHAPRPSSRNVPVDRHRSLGPLVTMLPHTLWITTSYTLLVSTQSHPKCPKSNQNKCFGSHEQGSEVPLSLIHI